MAFKRCLFLTLAAVASADEVCSAAEQADGTCKRRSGASYMQIASRSIEQTAKTECDCDKIPRPEPFALLEANRTGKARVSFDGAVHCEAFCQDSACPCLKPWAERCLVRSCAGCSECGGQVPYPTPVTPVAPVAPPPQPVAPVQPLPPVKPVQPPTAPTPDMEFAHRLAFMVCPQPRGPTNPATHIGGSIRRTACMTVEKYDAVAKSVADLLNSLPDTCTATFCPQADWAGCVLRMSGHDFMDFKDGIGGADACTDMNNADNAGLPQCLSTGDHGRALSQAYVQHCADVSLADFLVIAAESVMTETRKHVLELNPRAPMINFREHFKFGRTTNIERCVMGELPNPENSCEEVEHTFVRNLGLDPAQSAALMGVHTLGRAHPENSGYVGWWSDPFHARLFNNDYYIALYVKGWTFNRTFGPKKRSQWSRSDIGQRNGPGEHEMMLNTDLCLAYGHMGHYVNARSDDCCAWIDPPINGGGIDPRVLQATGDQLCGGPAHDAQGRPIVGRPMQVQCCQNYPGGGRIVDCGNPQRPSGFAAQAVMEFASDENAWLKIFQQAWSKVTANGHGQLFPLGMCPRQ